MGTKKIQKKASAGTAKRGATHSAKSPQKNLKRPKASKKPPQKKSSPSSSSARPSSAPPAHYSLPATADITAVTEIHKQLLKLSTGNSELWVDAAAVQKITTPCAQLLIAASGAFKASRFKIKNPSPVVEEALTLLGMGEQLKEWRA